MQPGNPAIRECRLDRGRGFYMTDPAAPSLQPSPTRPAITSFLTAGGVVLAVGGLYFGRDIFVPFALAILLSFVLTPLVNWLQQFKLPKMAQTQHSCHQMQSAVPN